VELLIHAKSGKDSKELYWLFLRPNPGICIKLTFKLGKKKKKKKKKEKGR
jgi:hypothetical protein